MFTSALVQCSMAALHNHRARLPRCSLSFGECPCMSNANRAIVVLPEHQLEVRMIPRERCAYSAIADRPPLKLPNSARIVVWNVVNLEFWSISRPMARQVLPAPTGEVFVPDVPNWSWHEYGMRVGVWRFFDLFKKLGIAPTLSINARVCEDYPRVAQQARDAGWEFMGHAYEQGPIHKEADQKAMIERAMGVIDKFTGKRR